MSDIPPRAGRDLSDWKCVDVLADWLTWNRSHAELADEVRRLFERRVPALSRSMRRDLGYFIEDRSTAVLARCVAMNAEIDACEAFLAWCAVMADEWTDPYARFGVGGRDFCDDRGPGGET